MNVIFEVQMSEIELDKEKTVYNYLHWKMRRNHLGITHFKEKYDDVDQHCASYEFYRGDKFLAIGEGDGIDEDDVGMGGVSVQVYLYRPEDMFK